MSPRPRREERHPDLQSAIKETAWKQIAELGAGALNLRAIARDLGITAPSIYNYFANRDALITALIVDAFASLADALQETIADLSEQEHARRLRILGLGYRAWAVTYPERYQLIFGTPLAGYVAPVEITQPVAGRSLASLIGVLQSAHTAGKLRAETGTQISAQLRAMFTAQLQGLGTTDEQVLFLAFSIWGQVHGLVSMEIGHQFPAFIHNPGEIYRPVIDLLVARYISD